MVRVVQPFAGDVGVNLGRREASMTKKLLNAAEIGAAVEQMGGEAVAEGVRAGTGVEAPSDEMFFEQAPHASRREPGPEPVQEDRRLARVLWLAERDPAADPRRRHGADWAEPFAAPLASNPRELLLVVEVVEVQADEFRDPESTPVERLEERPITDPERCIGSHGIEQADHLIDAKQTWQSFGLLRVT